MTKRYEIKMPGIFEIQYESGETVAKIWEDCDGYYQEYMSADDLDDLSKKLTSLAAVMRHSVKTNQKDTGCFNGSA